MFLKEVIFSRNKCNLLVNSAKEFNESKLYYKGDGGNMKPAIITSQRKSFTSEGIIKKGDYFYNELNKSLNKINYGLKSEALKYNIVRYQKGDFIHNHKDGAGIFITFVIQLSESSNYKGGDFVYWVDGNKCILENEMGYGILIGPEIEHEVTMVTDGVRYSFVLFLEYDDVILLSKQQLI